jgi:Carboxypeptidase regulatory-like domain
VTGLVRDADGGVLPGASVELVLSDQDCVASTATDSDGRFTIPSVTSGRYHVRVVLPGFDPSHIAIVVDNASPPPLEIVLGLSRHQEQVLVRGTASLLEVAATVRTALDRQLIETLASESISSGLSSLVTLTSPGVAADSNGGFHPLGEHAETSFVIDNQPVSDQQSRIFSNQLSPDAIQSVEVLTGVPPAEFGDKTSLLANVTTRSGLSMGRASGSASFGFGSFHTPRASASLGRGSDYAGNFISVDGIDSRRFLDTPEVDPLHAGGHMVNLFDRFDVHPSPRTRVQVNVIAARSVFQTPNTYDQQASDQDQRQRQHTLNLAASFNHVLGARAVIEVGGWRRHDRVIYDGSESLFADQPAALGQNRSLTNTGAKATFSYAAGRHAIRAGVQETTTQLTELFQTGITDPTFNTPCFTPAGDPSPDPSLHDPARCASLGLTINPEFLPALLPFDLSRGGSLFAFAGAGRITQWAGYVQDIVTTGAWTTTAGVRVDVYNGLSRDAGLQPRLGVTYRADRTRTVWRAAYGRVFLTPYNENLVLASSTGAGGFGNGLLGSVGGAPLTPARRNQYHVGLQQNLTGGIKIDADYFWKFTDGAYDFDVVLNTPLTFPVQFRRSAIDGGLVRVTLPAIAGVSAYTTFSHTRARLFGPELGGLRFSASYAPVARPDHDEPFQATTHVEYRTDRAAGLWIGLTWRYDSGLVAVSVPTYADALRLSGDEQAAMGLYCGSTIASVSQPIRTCTAPRFGATRVRIPPPGSENDDTNPPRIAPHHLVDLGIGFDGLKVGGLPVRPRVTVVNAFNTIALYNFLSTFAGTHFVTPRAFQGDLTIRF